MPQLPYTVPNMVALWSIVTTSSLKRQTKTVARLCRCSSLTLPFVDVKLGGQDLRSSRNSFDPTSIRVSVTTIRSFGTKQKIPQKKDTSDAKKKIPQRKDTSIPPDLGIIHIEIDKMADIIEEYERVGRDNSRYCVIDVRTVPEAIVTGKISDNVYILPVQLIILEKIFEMDRDAFAAYCNFPKPTNDKTLVFTCNTGVHSILACYYAEKAGYKKLINYKGGASEWFSPHIIEVRYKGEESNESKNK
jgi:rhodanese-related sulfurtransferase